MAYYSNYPHPTSNPYAQGSYGAADAAYPSNSGPPPPPAFGGGFGQQFGMSAYGGGYSAGGHFSAYNNQPAAVPGFTAPPALNMQMQMPMPPSLQYQQAQRGFQPVNMQYQMMHQSVAARNPNDPTVQELNRLKAQLKEKEEKEEKDDEIRKLQEQMAKLSEDMINKVAEEAANNEEMKKQMKNAFVDELIRRQDIGGTFEECQGVISPLTVYDDDDEVTKWHREEKGADMKGEKWDPLADAEFIRKGIRGLGTDEDKIIHLITHRTNAQRYQILKEYKTAYGRDLVQDLDSELSFRFKEAALAFFESPARYDAYCCKKAIYGLGTDERCLIEILMTRTNAQIQEMFKEYNAITYEKQRDPESSLERDIEGDTSGDFKRLLISAAQGNRRTISRDKLYEAVEEVEVNGKFTGLFKVNYGKLCDQKKCQRMAKELHDAGEDKWGTDEETFNRIFSTQDPYTLRETYNEYVKLSQRDILNSVDRETSGNFRKGLVTIAQSVKCRPMFFAERLRDSMKGLGTDDTTLIRIIASRAEIDMVQIKQCFLELTKQTLWNYIMDDTSGDYKKLLAQVVGKN